METLCAVLPEFAADLVRELRREGFDQAALTATTDAIQRVTFDDVANAGYIYMQPHGTAAGESLALETKPFSIAQLDSAGRLVGIEFLSPPRDFADKLRGHAVV